MEDKKLSEKESLELITQTIKNTQSGIVKEAGMPFLVYGYSTVAFALCIWYFITTTNNPNWMFLWFLLPIFGTAITRVYNKRKTSKVKIYTDRIIKYVWLVFGSTVILISCASFVFSIPSILFLIMLLIGMETTLTGLIIRFKPVIFSGITGIALSFLCTAIHGTDQLLLFAIIFVVIMIIPGHILNNQHKE